MCGRFVLTHPHAALAHLFDAAPANDLPPVPDYNICPTRPVAAVTGAGENGGRRLRPMRWGFIPHWYKTPADGPLLINARAETLAEKPAFRAAARARRALVPATGFYEWTKGADGARLPWYLAPEDGPLALAGVWQDWTDPATGLAQPTVAIVTCEASPDIAAIHHRMPVIVAPADWPLWLGEAGHGAARLMRPAPPGTLQVRRVGPAVNSNRATGPDLVEPSTGC